MRSLSAGATSASRLRTSSGGAVRAVRVSVRFALAALFIASGTSHFVRSEFFTSIVPPWLPWALALVWISGFFEIAGAIALLVPATRRAAGIGLIALMVAVFPANVHMALHAESFPHFAPGLLWLRLPLQAVLIALAWWCSRRDRGQEKE